MRKLLLILTICFAFQNIQAQTMEEKLYYTCKVWGFAKYYHSEVSVCNVNWDSVLLAVLPDIRTASSSTEFNDALMEMLNAAGPMAISTTYFPDTLPAELKRNRDFSWMSSAVLRTDVQVVLDTIKNNFRPHVGCWVDYSSSSTPGPYSFLLFGGDSVMLNLNTTSTFPTQDQRLLQLYKYWNIVRYFNPYNYVSDLSWDTVLYNFCVPIADAANADNLFLLYEKISAAIDDAHVEGMTFSSEIQSIPGYYQPKIRVKFLEGKYVVVKSALDGIALGDAIVSIDGKTPAQWEDSLRQYTSSGNLSVFRRDMCRYFLGRKVSGTSINLVLEDSTATSYTYNASCVWPNSDISFFYDPYYAVDSLSSIHWKALNCDIGYVNIGNLAIGEEASMYNDLKDKSAIIFDLRNGALGTSWSIAELLFPSATEVAKFTMPDTDYPGTFYWSHQYVGYANPNYYYGKVILLMDENVQSHGEWSCMVLGATGDVVKVGSQTAAADGNITRMRLSQDLYTGFTSLGTFYPNGDSTQRIGIVPDTVVTQTRFSVRRHRDNVLEKALKIAGCELSVSNVTTEQPVVSVYPNPANETVSVDIKTTSEKNVSVRISDVSGRVLLEKEIYKSVSLDISKLLPGLYFVQVNSDSQNIVTKLIKE